MTALVVTAVVCGFGGYVLGYYVFGPLATSRAFMRGPVILRCLPGILYLCCRGAVNFTRTLWRHSLREGDSIQVKLVLSFSKPGDVPEKAGADLTWLSPVRTEVS